MNKPSLLFVFLVFCFSCQNEVSPTNEIETPKAFEAEYSEFLSIKKRGGDNLVYKLYEEQVAKSPALQKLKSDLENVQAKGNECKENLQTYTSKSDSYYRVANSMAVGLEDSLLKKRMVSFLESKMKNYDSNKKELETLIKTMDNQKNVLRDHYTVLQIVLTHPMIERYQTDNKPDKKAIQDQLKAQESLIQKIDSLTPKF